MREGKGPLSPFACHPLSCFSQINTQSHRVITPASKNVSASRKSVKVMANKAVNRKQQVVLRQDVKGVGKAGELMAVPVGYWRNYLLPQGLASFADEGVLESIKKQKEAELRAKAEEKAKAQAMATALATIGKFMIKKKIGQGEAIFGSVTASDLVEAIKMQTGRELDKRAMTVPEIKTLGTYDCSIKLHAEVIGSFKVVVQKDTSSS